MANDVAERPKTTNDSEQDQASDEQSPSLTTWTTVGAITGATIGGIVGAAVAATLVQRPDLLEQATEAINRDGGRVAKAATTAAGGVLAAKSIQGLGQDGENGERSQLMKQTARQAAAAAASATRDEIVSIQRGRRARPEPRRVSVRSAL